MRRRKQEFEFIFRVSKYREAPPSLWAVKSKGDDQAMCNPSWPLVGVVCLDETSSLVVRRVRYPDSRWSGYIPWIILGLPRR